MEGKILGNRYQLVERIGGGGMAIVYKAKCLLLNRYVAVKILRSEFTDDEEFVKRFRIEAQAAASLNHPNIVSIYDVGKQDDAQYIVMEFIDGITLKDYINQNGALPWKEAVSIAIQICSALEQAHKNHIVHRDIKPHNIMLTSEGIAKVTDFGIARAVTSATITMVGSTIGSVHYFSPEQARGGYTDEKSDLYSLGVTLYEMVTGQVPFDGESPVAVALKHIQEKAERPADLNPTVPKGVNDLILKAMKKNQNLRYQSASEMLNDLHRTLSEPNARIVGSNISEDLPTKKMQAVGTDIEPIYENEDEDMKDDSPSGVIRTKIGNATVINDENGSYAVFETNTSEGEDTMATKKKDRLSMWLGIAAGLIIAGIIFYIGLKLVLPLITPDVSEVYVVEDFTGKNFNDVLQELSKYNITAVDNERVNSDDIDQDVIISQDVAVGNTLKPNSSIKFRVSNGPKLVQIPDISGQESRVGEQILRENDLIPTQILENDETVATGLVIRTEPAAFEEVDPYANVTVYVSLGPKLEQVTVPNLVGRTLSQAEKLILESKLKIGKTIPEDVVNEVALITKQYPLAGSTADEDTPVELDFTPIEEEPIAEDPGTSMPGQPANGTPDTPDTPGITVPGDTDEPPVKSERKTKNIIISLDPSKSYGDNVMVYVESTPSDTNQRIVELNQSIPVTQFPFSVPVTLAEQGTTHVIVKLDGWLALEDDR
ncbi:MAG: Stk1 family PASTA domain-containing Ser/Thr kinase [Clostridiaceae bacterium]|nr:Stk1 family PASTA domain-containing Ser/Thr kinase [Clostridiaceae bacterium]